MVTTVNKNNPRQAEPECTYHLEYGYLGTPYLGMGTALEEAIWYWSRRLSF